VTAAVARYYTDRLRDHGPTAAGVDWSSESSQELRFLQLLRLVEPVAGMHIVDWGCGYGALARCLIDRGDDFRYTGFDISEAMIDAARSGVDDSRCAFTSRASEVASADVVVASGIFNVRLDTAIVDWERHVRDTLDVMDGLARSAFAFNMLTRYSHPPRRHDRLYYADPAAYFSLCKKRYSRYVAVAHDYDLYEFTVCVRHGAEPVPFA
jgi:SAM-dependent methyltransferase